MPKSSKLLRRRNRDSGGKEKPVKKFKSETDRERDARMAKKSKPKKLSNKEISYVWILHFIEDLAKPSLAKYNEIAGMTLRGARPEKISEMIYSKLDKMASPIEKLLLKRDIISAKRKKMRDEEVMESEDEEDEDDGDEDEDDSDDE